MGFTSAAFPWMTVLIFLVVLCSGSAADADECAAGQGACAGADHNLLLQLPGVKVDATVLEAELPNSEIVMEKGAGPHNSWMADWMPAAVIPGYHNDTKKILKDMKLNTNAEGDLDAFMSAFVCDSFAVCFLFGVFCMLYCRYPLVFKNNALKGTAPDTLDNSYFGWIGATWRLTSEEVEHAGGLDAAMLLVFVDLAIRLLLTIGIPMMVILCPLHAFVGGHPLNTDKLSQIGMGNVVEGAGGRWLYWVHAVFVWYVIVMAQRTIFQAQEEFVRRRTRWLRQMPKPRSTTVLVEGIPREFCTDEGLKEEFCKLFPGDMVDSAYVVRKTDNLLSLVDSYKSADQSLSEGNFEWQSNGGTDDARPQCREAILGKFVDKIDFYTEQKKLAGDAIATERNSMRDPSKSEEICASAGFVTFKTERDAAIALSLKVRADEYVFMMSIPPDPADVQYCDLAQDEVHLHAKACLGYACIAGVFFGFVPIILAISSIINLDALRSWLPIVEKLIVAFPMSERLLEGVLASAALTLFMSFLPTVLMLVFDNFYQLKAGRWAQHSLQIWYFWFQVVFVLLITAVGSSLWDTLMLLVNHPTVIFELLADRLPSTTHFYLNFVMMQWVIHGLNLTRYVQLSKFKALCLICEEERAKELAEPEDQDYYGMGARSARFTLNLVIGLVYCSLCPLITVVTAVNFMICRVVYGYLLTFAETRKADLGGQFWVTSLKHVQCGLFIYGFLMVGVLLNRAASFGPAVVAFPALGFLLRSYFRFQSEFQWVGLSLEEFTSDKKTSYEAIRESSRQTYEQPELTEPVVSVSKGSKK